MAQTYDKKKVGELRPSQALFTFGIGSLVDLPDLSVIVMGLDDWPARPDSELSEPRLLSAVSERLGTDVKRLLAPPSAPDTNSPFDDDALLGMPIASFPRWLVCPYCRLMARINSDLFELKHNPYRPDRTGYVHHNCQKKGKPPKAIPVRFLVGCENGHLDDFPWIEFVHQGPSKCPSLLSLREMGASGEAADVEVKCKSCGQKRRMADAFGKRGSQYLSNCSGGCSGRRPHLRDFDPEPCDQLKTCLLLGASNSWFPVMLSAISIPTAANELGRIVESIWADASDVAEIRGIKLLKKLHPMLSRYEDSAIWTEISDKQSGSSGGEEQEDLKTPEWRVLAKADPDHNSRDFRLSVVSPPSKYERHIEKVIKVERLREVRALIGFGRIDPPYADASSDDQEYRVAPLSRSNPEWVPSIEVRGEGVFLKFRDSTIDEWLLKCASYENDFLVAHQRWRSSRGQNPEVGYPGLKFALLHSISHLLMRQFSLECGYAAASVRERIYSNSYGSDERMNGILIYTSAPDSEGTLGGLVGLAESAVLEHHLDQALRSATLCASDPLCSEHSPLQEDLSLHGAACHACLLSPETSCESGNRYLDRSLLVPTYTNSDYAFFEVTDG